MCEVPTVTVTDAFIRHSGESNVTSTTYTGHTIIDWYGLYTCPHQRSYNISLANSSGFDLGLLFFNSDIFKMRKYFCKRSFLCENVAHEHFRFKFLSDSEPSSQSTIQSAFNLFY